MKCLKLAIKQDRVTHIVWKS